MEFELTHFLKPTKIYFQIYSKEKGDTKKVLEYILNSKSDKLTEEDLKFLKINKKKFKKIIMELDMLGFVELGSNIPRSDRLKLEIRSIKKSMKKYKKRLTKKGIRNYNKAIKRREKEL